MHVGVGEGGREALDGQDHDVRVGRAEVVLDEEPVAGPGGGRGKARVLELQPGRRVDAGHEGDDQAMVVCGQRIDRRPVDGRRRDLRLEAVEGPMGVHDQKVHRVAAGGPRRGHLVDGVAPDAIVAQVRRPTGEGIEPSGLRHVDEARRRERRQHLRDRVHELLVDPAGLRDVVEVLGAHPARPLDRVVEHRIGHPGRQALVAERRESGTGVVGPGPGSLEQAQEVLGPIIGLERPVEQRGQEEGSLAQFLHHLPLGRAEVPRFGHVVHASSTSQPQLSTVNKVTRAT